MRDWLAAPATAQQETSHGFGFSRCQSDPGENLFDEVRGASVEDPHHHLMDEAADRDLSRLRSEVNIVMSVKCLSDQTFGFQFGLRADKPK